MLKCTFKIAVLSLSALAFVSCKKDDKSGAAGDMMSFTASIDNGGAKTWIDGVNVKWTSGDQININGGTFKAEVEGDSTTAVFTGSPVEGTTYKALYPESLYKGENDYELPDEQTYNEADKLSGINPMYAESSTTELQFDHLCGLLKLNVKGDGKVKEIKVSKYGVALCGSFTIDNNRAVVSSTNDSVVTLNCGDGVPINNETATTFYIALPEGSYDSLNVELKNDSKVWKTSLGVVLHAGKIRTKELTGVDAVKQIPPGCIPGEFTVADPTTDNQNSGDETKVYFSKGNLQCVRKGDTWAADGYEWRFADNQWDIVEQSGQDVGGDYANQDTVTLFGWATSGWDNGNYFFQPYNTSKAVESPYTWENGFGYGPLNDDPKWWRDLVDDCAEADWGSSYCKQEGIDPYTTWRTLTSDEWKHLLNTRIVKGGTGEGFCYQRATINSDATSVYGMILYPDDYTSQTSATSYESTEWAAMESAGCVFLPAAGSRFGSLVESVNSADLKNFYWSTSGFVDQMAYGMFFSAEDVWGATFNDRRYGRSVRLVRSVE